MPEKVSKTAKRSAGVKVVKKRLCTSCKTGETQVVQFAGYGPKGFFWVCQGIEGKQQPCGFKERTA